MKPKLIFLIIFLIIGVNLFAQPYLEWAKTDSSNNNELRNIKSCGFDSIGNIYFCGYELTNTFQIDNYTLSSVKEYILGKIDTLDNIIWIKSIDAAADWLSFSAYKMYVSNSGNSYTEGVGIEGSIYNFGGILYTNSASSGSRGIYKHDSNGNEMWCKEYLGHILYCFNIDNTENLIINFWYSENDPYNVFTNFPINSLDNSTLGIAKYDISGNPVWAKSYGGTTNGGTTNYAQLGSICCDSQNNIIGTGYYTSNVFVLGTDTLPPPTQYPDYPYNPMNSFVLKLSPAGDVLWSYTLPTEWSRGYNVAVNSKDEIICTGVFRQSGIWFNNGTVLENPGEQARYIMKLSPQGELMWIKCIYVDFPFNQTVSLSLKNIAFDDEDNIFIGGNTAAGIGNTTSCICYQSDTILHYAPPKYKGMFILKFSDCGNLIYVESFYSTDPGDNGIYGFDVNDNAEIVCSGRFHSDSLTIIDTTLYPDVPTHDPVFIVKLKDKDIQQLSLPQGWSYVSTYIKPDSINIAKLFSPVSQNIKILKNSTGMVYWPEFNLNLIGNYNIHKGYQICMNTADVLQIRGYRIRPQETEIALEQGWQILPYPRTTPATLETMLLPINNNTEIIKNSTGQIYWPAWGVNAIETLYPGQGYLIKMTAQDTLVYPH